MTIWENRSLRLARETARDAEQAWRGHKDHCFRCDDAAQRHKLEKCCGEGWAIYHTRRTTSETLEHERELAKQPVPGQNELFPGLTS
jgi:hypothetical protein